MSPRYLAPTLLLFASIALAGPSDARQPIVASSSMSADPAQCVSSVGPGMPPPASVASGISGFHASWYGQSGYATLCPGQRSTVTVAFYNSGTRGWVSGRMGEMAFLGAVDPASSGESESALGGTGGTGPDTDWPSPNRAAAQPAAYVGPGQVAWFQFTIEAPTAPGTYRLYLRPVIEGTTWMEDQGAYVEIHVPAAASAAISIVPAASASGPVGWTREYTAVASPGACVDLGLIDATDVRDDGTILDAQGNARLSRLATITSVNGLVAGAPFVSCAVAGGDTLLRFGVSSSVPNAYVRPVAFRDIDGDDALDVASEPFAVGGALRFLPPAADSGERIVSVGVVDLAEKYFVDASGSTTYRYDATDRFTRDGAVMTIASFEQLLSRGDLLRVSYYSDPSLNSTFSYLTDVGRQAPALQLVLDSWDSGPMQDDVGVRIIERATNIEAIEYVLERARMNTTATCDATSGAYGTVTTIQMDVGLDEAMFVDRDLAVGAYCYRVGIADPLSAEWTYVYEGPVVVANPPAVVRYPRSVDARLAVSVGSLSIIDAGDVIKLAFDKEMLTPAAGTVLLTDADGTVAEVRCDTQDCWVNTGPETIGDRVYGRGFVITIAMRSAPRIVVAGGAAGLQAHATIIGGDLVDLAGNAWDLAGSDDVVVGAPD